MMKWLIILSAIFLFGCNPAKQILKNQQQFDAVGKAWAEKHPCVNDSITIFKPGKIDSVLIPFKKMDTVTLYLMSDSVAKAYALKHGYDATECRLQVSEAYNAGYDQAADECSKIKIAVKQPDTLATSVQDKRQIDLLLNNIEVIQSQFTDTLKESAGYKTQRNTAYWIIAGMGILLVCLIILYIKRLIP